MTVNVCGSGAYRAHVWGTLMLDRHWTGSTIATGLSWKVCAAGRLRLHSYTRAVSRMNVLCGSHDLTA